MPSSKQLSLEQKINLLFRWDYSWEQIQAINDKKLVPQWTLSAKEKQQYKDAIVKAVIEARKTSLWAKHYIDTVMQSTDFAFILSEHSAPPMMAGYYPRGHCIIFYVNNGDLAAMQKLSLDKSYVEGYYMRTMLHEFTHAYFHTIHSIDRTPRLDNKSPVSRVPDKKQQLAISEAIDRGNQRLSYLLESLGKDPESFIKRTPAVFSLLNASLEMYAPRPEVAQILASMCTTIYSKSNNCFDAIRSIDKGERSEIWDGAKGMLVTQYFFEGDRYTFPGHTFYRENPLFQALTNRPNIPILYRMIMRDMTIFENGSERKKMYGANYGSYPDDDVVVGDFLFGERLAHHAELNRLVDLYPEYLACILKSVKVANQKLGWKSSKEEERTYKQLLTESEKTTKLLEEFSTFYENPETIEKESETTPEGAELEEFFISYKTPEATAKENEVRQINLGIGLSSFLPIIGSVGLSLIEGVQQLAADPDTSSSVEPVSPESEDASLPSLVPAMVITTAAIGLGYYCYSFWSTRNRVDHSPENKEKSSTACLSK